MTVKLTKFFSSTAVIPTMTTASPSTETAATSYYHQQQHIQFMQQETQQQSSLPYNPYIAGGMDSDDLYDDDNMSLYLSSTAGSGIMTQRGHSCNNSQRPLLGERKPPKMLLNGNAAKTNKKSTGFNQPQRHLQLQQKQQQQHEGKPQLLPQQKTYISPYVQQQKRDSAKGLHGFNDFDILSQQYTEHLRSSPHIGYPYGSPPSPSAKSNDFVFDPLPQQNSLYGNDVVHQQQNAGQYRIQKTGNDINETDYSYYERNAYNVSGSGSGSPDGGSNGLPAAVHYMGKSSRFDDDFCTRRNATFSEPQPVLLSEKAWTPSVPAVTDDMSGPFIFGGVPPERFNHHRPQNGDNTLPKQQNQLAYTSSPTAAESSSNCAIDVSDKHPPYNDQVTVLSSDTSSSSRNSSGKGVKFLLRKSKSKRSAKEKKFDTSGVQTKSQPKQLKTPSIKCVLVGDGAVGKTNLILTYLKNRFNTEHVPTASDIYNADVLVNDNPVHLTICDTAGQDTLDNLRQLCYPDSDVFVLCFSVVRPETFHAVKTKWAPKFSKSKASLILVGTQADLRKNSKVLKNLQLNGESPISHSDAWDLAASIGASYIETSSATQDKVKEVFDTAIWEGLTPTILPPTPTPPLWKKILCLA
ncbi:uncharacterized protein RhoU isoform X1 [Bactrocera oleae]|uniref:uncharacterized protein RhoU isoform X1 n=1 Tax=Bactrocera oleae TaxID=104688 RepID=UPI00387EC09F